MKLFHIGSTTPADLQDQERQTFRTLYVLIGGSGMKTGLRLRKKCLETWGVAQLPFQRYLWLDTDPRDVESQTFNDERVIEQRLRFNGDDLVELSLPLARVQQFMANPTKYPWLWQWLDPQTLRDLGTNAHASEGARQIRALGRLAFTHSFSEFRKAFERHIRALNSTGIEREAAPYGYKLDSQAIEVSIICSLAGGTGSGCFLEAARWMRELAGDNVTFTAHLFMPAIFKARVDNDQPWQDVRANAYAALQELNDLACMNRPGARPAPLWIGEKRVERPKGLPFHEVFLVDAKNEADMELEDPADDEAFEMLADALFFDFDKSEFGTKKRSHRCNVRPYLGTFTQAQVPVDDGNSYSEGKLPHYVFQFPNAFGAMGIARVPFERLRLQRAAGAWLARRMLTTLVESENSLDAQQVSVLLAERGTDVSINLDAIIAQLLDDGRGSSLPEAGIAVVVRQLSEARQALEDNFKMSGRAPEEKIRTLNDAPEYGRRLRENVLELLQVGRVEVQRQLRDAGTDVDRGRHLKAIRDKANSTRDAFRTEIDKFGLRLLCDLCNYGYDVAVDTLNALVDQLTGYVDREVPVPQWSELADLDVDPGTSIRDAAEKLAQAQALVLPLYGRMAKQYCAERSKNELDDASQRCVKTAREYLTQAEQTYRAWVTESYRAAAIENSRELLRGLVAYIGEQTEIVGNDGQVAEVRATGFILRLRQLRGAVQSSIDHFQSLERSYHKTRRSSRNGDDLGGGLELGAKVIQALESDESTGQAMRSELITSSWEGFLNAHTQLLRPGHHTVLEAGMVGLIERSVSRATNTQPWREVQGLLESWTIHHLAKKKFLADVDATTLLSEPGHAKQQLNHITKAAQPWLQLDPAREGDMDAIQVMKVVGSQYPDGQLIEDWRHGQAGWQAVTSTSGSLVALVEKMAFPIIAVHSLRDLRSAYEYIFRNRPSEIARRHTVLDPLDLPVISPPADDQEAIRWFHIDRLALEATMLGVFHPAGGQRQGRYVEYTYEDAELITQHEPFPRSLRAIAASLRANPNLHNQLHAEVQRRYRAIFSDRQSAIASVMLALVYANSVFPPPQQASHPEERYLEHELARSVLAYWREAAVRRAGLDDAQLREEIAAATGVLDLWREDSPIDSPMAQQTLQQLALPAAAPPLPDDVW